MHQSNRKVNQKELYKIAEQAWEDCDGCTNDDKMFWINGFIRAANLFGDIESLPNLMTDDEIAILVADLTDSEKREENLTFLAQQAQELGMGYGSPYCPVCSGCGEDGCCNATSCEQHPDGSYCGTYLNDLKVEYMMSKWFYEEVYESLPPEKKTECDAAYEKALDSVHGKKQGD